MAVMDAREMTTGEAEAYAAGYAKAVEDMRSRCALTPNCMEEWRSIGPAFTWDATVRMAGTLTVDFGPATPSETRAGGPVEAGAIEDRTDDMGPMEVRNADERAIGTCAAVDKLVQSILCHGPPAPPPDGFRRDEYQSGSSLSAEFCGGP